MDPAPLTNTLTEDPGVREVADGFNHGSVIRGWRPDVVGDTALAERPDVSRLREVALASRAAFIPVVLDASCGPCGVSSPVFPLFVMGLEDCFDLIAQVLYVPEFVIRAFVTA